MAPDTRFGGHVNFDVQGFAGQYSQVVAYFHQPDGAFLKDFDGQYRDRTGHVAVSVDFSPAFPVTSFPDVVLFMPYTQLHMAPGVMNLFFFVKVWDMSNPAVPFELACSSPPTPFTFTTG
jgi:hypothetical protein